MKQPTRPAGAASRLALLALVPLAILLQSCAVLDPNNIVGRHRAASIDANTPFPIKDDSWKQAALDEVWSTINEKYYDPALNGVDWQAARRKHEALILAATSDDDFWERLDRMAGELKDAHTRVHGPKQVAQIRDHESHSLGIGMLELGDALVVTSVHAESDAWWAGVRGGMVIRSIDGAPALATYRRLMDEARESSTPWARARSAVRKISAGDIDTKINMVFLRGDGSEISATLKRRVFRVPPETISRVLPSGFGYVRFSAFDENLQSGIMAGITRLKDTPGMIVDLRGNGGGSLRMSNKLIERFLSENAKGARVLTRTGKPITVAFIPVINLETELAADRENGYRQRLVILINESSASGSEIFASTLQDLGRATVIGRRSCGCLLGYLGYADLPGGGQLAYSEIGFLTPKGNRIEGEGVKPDIDIALAREDIVLSRDRTLEAAEAFLRERVNRK